MSVPTNAPAPGYYYHYKHDPSVAVNHYAYQFMGIGHHTEDDCRPEDQYMLVYRPLYEDAFVYVNGKMFDLRPLGMVMEPVEKDGKTFDRFTCITDPEVIAQLQVFEKKMYG